MTAVEADEYAANFLTLKELGLDVKIRLSEPLDIPSNDSARTLLAVSNEYGLLFAATANGFVVADLAELRTAFTSAKRSTKPLLDHPRCSINLQAAAGNDAVVTFLTVADGETRLVVGLADGRILIWDIGSFASDAEPSPILTVAAPQAGQRLIELTPNPSGYPELCAAIYAPAESTSSHTLDSGAARLLDVRSGKWREKDLCSNCTALCWSAKGKRIAAGLASGNIQQLTPEGDVKDTIAPPPELTQQGSYHVSDLLWTENESISVTYSVSLTEPADEPDHRDELYVILHDTKTAPPTKYVKVVMDPAPPFGDSSRAGRRFRAWIRNWNPMKHIIFTASVPSTDVGATGCLSNQSGPEAWKLLELEETSRPVLPFSSVDNATDSSPFGLALDLTAVEDVDDPTAMARGEDGAKLPAAPILYIYTNDGVLLGYHVINTEPGAGRYAGVIGRPPKSASAPTTSTASARQVEETEAATSASKTEASAAAPETPEHALPTFSFAGPTKADAAEATADPEQPAAQTPVPPATQEDLKEATQPVAFSFGAPKAAAQTPAPTAIQDDSEGPAQPVAFSFGAPKAAAQTPTSPTTQDDSKGATQPVAFSFGAPKAAAQMPAPSAIQDDSKGTAPPVTFSFGAPKVAAQTPTSPAIQEGSKGATQPVAFSFGAPQSGSEDGAERAEPSSAATSASQPTTTGFSFGSGSSAFNVTAFSKPSASSAATSSTTLAFGQPSAFGQGSGVNAFTKPATTSPAPTVSAFGQTSASAQNSTSSGSKPGFGSTSPFGQTPTFGSSAFGKPSTPGQAFSTTSAFGSPSPFGKASESSAASPASNMASAKPFSFGTPAQSGRSSAFAATSGSSWLTGAATPTKSAFGSSSATKQSATPVFGERWSQPPKQEEQSSSRGQSPDSDQLSQNSAESEDAELDSSTFPSAAVTRPSGTSEASSSAVATNKIDAADSSFSLSDFGSALAVSSNEKPTSTEGLDGQLTVDKGDPVPTALPETASPLKTENAEEKTPSELPQVAESTSEQKSTKSPVSNPGSVSPVSAPNTQTPLASEPATFSSGLPKAVIESSGPAQTPRETSLSGGSQPTTTAFSFGTNGGTSSVSAFSQPSNAPVTAFGQGSMVNAFAKPAATSPAPTVSLFGQTSAPGQASTSGSHAFGKPSMFGQSTASAFASAFASSTPFKKPDETSATSPSSGQAAAKPFSFGTPSQSGGPSAFAAASGSSSGWLSDNATPAKPSVFGPGVGSGQRPLTGFGARIPSSSQQPQSSAREQSPESADASEDSAQSEDEQPIARKEAPASQPVTSAAQATFQAAGTPAPSFSFAGFGSALGGAQAEQPVSKDESVVKTPAAEAIKAPNLVSAFGNTSKAENGGATEAKASPFSFGSGGGFGGSAPFEISPFIASATNSAPAFGQVPGSSAPTASSPSVFGKPARAGQSTASAFSFGTPSPFAPSAVSKSQPSDASSPVIEGSIPTAQQKPGTTSAAKVSPAPFSFAPQPAKAFAFAPAAPANLGDSSQPNASPVASNPVKGFTPSTDVKQQATSTFSFGSKSPASPFISNSSAPAPAPSTKQNNVFGSSNGQESNSVNRARSAQSQSRISDTNKIGTVNEVPKGIASEAQRVFLLMEDELATLKRDAEACGDRLPEKGTFKSSARTFSDLTDHNKWSFADVSQILRLASELHADADSLKDHEKVLRTQLKILQDQQIKAEVKREEVEKLLKARSDPALAQEIPFRELGPEHQDNRIRLRNGIRSTSGAITELKRTVDQLKHRIQMKKDGKAAMEVPPLDTMQRATRNITRRLQEQLERLSLLEGELKAARAPEDKDDDLSDDDRDFALNPKESTQASMFPQATSRDPFLPPPANPVAVQMRHAQRRAKALRSVFVAAQKVPILNTSSVKVDGHKTDSDDEEVQITLARGPVEVSRANRQQRFGSKGSTGSPPLLANHTETTMPPPSLTLPTSVKQEPTSPVLPRKELQAVPAPSFKPPALPSFGVSDLTGFAPLSNDSAFAPGSRNDNAASGHRGINKSKTRAKAVQLSNVTSGETASFFSPSAPGLKTAPVPPASSNFFSAPFAVPAATQKSSPVPAFSFSKVEQGSSKDFGASGSSGTQRSFFDWAQPALPNILKASKAEEEAAEDDDEDGEETSVNDENRVQQRTGAISTSQHDDSPDDEEDGDYVDDGSNQEEDGEDEEWEGEEEEEEEEEEDEEDYDEDEDEDWQPDEGEEGVDEEEEGLSAVEEEEEET